MPCAALHAHALHVALATYHSVTALFLKDRAMKLTGTTSQGCGTATEMDHQASYNQPALQKRLDPQAAPSRRVFRAPFHASQSGRTVKPWPAVFAQGLPSLCPRCAEPGTGHLSNCCLKRQAFQKQPSSP